MFGMVCKVHLVICVITIHGLKLPHSGMQRTNSQVYDSSIAILAIKSRHLVGWFLSVVALCAAGTGFLARCQVHH